MTTRAKPMMTDRDEAEVRAFYGSCGFTSETIERAIQVRRSPPADEQSSALAGKKKRGRHAVNFRRKLR
jgi:hypothetical protein